MTDSERIAELEADNAALSSTLKSHWIEVCDVRDVCQYCEAVVVYADYVLQLQTQCDHKKDCILTAEHPGSRLLERLEAAEKVVDHYRNYEIRDVDDESLAAYDKLKEKINE